MADAHGSGPCARKGVGVQLPPSPPVARGAHVRRKRGHGPLVIFAQGAELPETPRWSEGDMSVALVTGSAGLIGSEAVRHFAGLGLDVVGIDNDMRQLLLRRGRLDRVEPAAADQRTGRVVHPLRASTSVTATGSRRSSAKYGRDIAVVIHTAAQPSHDWAAQEPYTDFDVNAVGTLNVLENARLHCPEAPFIHCSTNKVYGDRPNSLPLDGAGDAVRDRARPPVRGRHRRGHVDRRAACTRSSASSKVAADVMVQEYGRYFGMKHRLLPRRHADRAGTLGRRAARLPRLPDALRHGGPHLQPVRLQGQDGPRRDPLATTC